MFVGYQQIAVGNAVLPPGTFNVPNGTARVMLQATAESVRYTMDNATLPTAVVGMMLVAGLAPEWFELEDLNRMFFVSANIGALAYLNVHYYAPSPLSL
jgi:hypothetical protein